MRKAEEGNSSVRYDGLRYGRHRIPMDRTLAENFGAMKVVRNTKN